MVLNVVTFSGLEATQSFEFESVFGEIRFEGLKNLDLCDEGTERVVEFIIFD
jgi:hypothetical protein